jgi:hypothetical protein
LATNHNARGRLPASTQLVVRVAVPTGATVTRRVRVRFCPTR